MPRVENVLILSLALSVFPELASTQSSLNITDIPGEICSVVAGRHFKRLQSNTYDYFPGACKYYLANIELTSTGSHSVEVLLDTTSDEDVEITYIAIENGVEAVRFRFTPNGVYLNNQNSSANLPVLLPQASVVEKGFYYILTDSSEIRIEYALGERLYLYFPESLVHGVDGLCGDDDAQSQHMLDSGIGLNPTFPVLGNTYEYLYSDCTPVDAHIVLPEESSLCNGHFDINMITDCGLDITIYKRICHYEMYASPTNQSVDRGVCLALAEHYRMCSIVDGNAVDWRSLHDCVVSCPDGKVYVESGSQCPKTCEKSQLTEVCSDQGGVDGCDCPSEFFWNEETELCVQKTDCFCIHDGTRYAKGEIVDIECSTCECMGGSWNCLRNDTSCPGTCSITGKFLTTFNTFDGQLFQNVESCEHLLIQPLPPTDNSAPSKTFQLSLGHTCSYGMPFCPPYVKLTIQDAGVLENFRFHPDGRVRFQNLYMQLPFFGKIGVVVRNIMDNYLLVNTDFGLTIMWDWKSDLEIKASGALRGKVFGMCGLFNGAINDELTLPTSEVTTDLKVFGRGWRTGFCFMPRDLTSYNGPQGICRSDAVFHLKVTARCDLMSKQPFHTCHGVVDPAKYISDCKTLGCTATTGDVFKNTCPSFAAYIEECARQGQIIAWAGSLECQPDCPVDRVLLHCPHTEHRMCSDHHISMVGVEDKTCYPGCYCTPDKIFNDYSGECVEPDTCPCITTNHALKQPGSEFYSECNICTCHAGNYDCHSSNCTDCEYDQEYSSCACGKTCANQNSRICPEEGDEECQGACECPAGTVLDEFNNECIAPEDCPCFHGNETFPVNTVSTRPDELCLCKPGAFWECIPLAPEGSCWAYGMTSFNTYDDRTYTHNGRKPSPI
ncbi:mucin-5B-like [Lytechinus pictus]|uniref:mucin-5B-like n=1 Tax=Lytechinus pictus TaxID=7653 RepID=UPI0030BA2A11